MSILLIGAHGFIGQNLKTSLVNIGSKVNAPSSTLLNLNNIQSIINYTKNKYYDYIIYCAIDKQANIESNKKHIINLLNANINHNFIVLISSRAIYDGLKNFSYIKPIPCTDLPEPRINTYPYLKYYEEKVIMKHTNKYQIYRLFDIFENLHKDHGFRWINNYNSGSLKYNEILTPVHLTDAMRFISHNILAENPQTGIYNVCGKKTVSSKDYFVKLGIHICPTKLIDIEKTGYSSL